MRAHGAVAVHKTPQPSSFGTPPAPELAQSYISQPITPTKSGNPFRILTSERRESLLPSYHASSPHSAASPPYPATKQNEPISPTSKYSRATDCPKKTIWKAFGNRKSGRQSVGPPLPINPQREMEISAPMGVNPQFAHLMQRPDSALHPSRTGESEAFRWRPS